MPWYNKVLNLFVRDSLERKRFIDEFNSNAKDSFKNLSVDVLFLASTCPGEEDSSYRHEFSAPRFASGFEIQVCGGNMEMVNDVLTMAYYPFVDNLSYNQMSMWQREVKAPSERELTASRITRLTQSITEKNRMDLFRCRAAIYQYDFRDNNGQVLGNKTKYHIKTTSYE